MQKYQQEIRKGERFYNYLPARLHEQANGVWQIEFFIESPTDGNLQRKRIRVNKILNQYKRKADARKHIDSIIQTINAKLFSGWNPNFEGEDARLFVPLSDVVETYLMEKTKELRPDSMRCYSSVCNMLLAWSARHSVKLFCSLFSRGLAVRFLDYLYNERNVSARSYNSYIKTLRCFFEWAKEKGYTKDNPFGQMKMKRKSEKKRILIDRGTRKRIAEHLRGSPFLLVCHLVFYSLIRPKEIRNIKIGDIDLNAHTIKVSGEVAKNHKTRYCTLSPQTEELIKASGVLRLPRGWFVFSDRETLAPGTVILYDSKFTKEFAKLRKELNLPNEMQLYSLRDSGIFEMLKAGVDDLTVMQHADHSSLNITTIYASHEDPELTARIRKKAPDF